MIDLLPRLTACDGVITWEATQPGSYYTTGGAGGHMSQAEESRAAPPVLALVGGDAGEQGRAGQTPETRWRQVLLGGGELPTHVRAAASALGDCPSVPERKREELVFFLFEYFTSLWSYFGQFDCFNLATPKGFGARMQHYKWIQV